MCQQISRSTPYMRRWTGTPLVLYYGSLPVRRQAIVIILFDDNFPFITTQSQDFNKKNKYQN